MTQGRLFFIGGLMVGGWILFMHWAWTRGGPSEPCAAQHGVYVVMQGASAPVCMVPSPQERRRP